MRRTVRNIGATVAVAAMLWPAGAASAAEGPGGKAVARQVDSAQLQSSPGLSAAQKSAIASFAGGDLVNQAAAPRSVEQASVALASASRRASYYRGSALMWTRDNVDFGYDWSTVTWTSAYQQAGWIWPNIARNRGITKYYNTARDDRFRALNTIGAGVPTPWGDVKVYSSDFTHRLKVTYNGAWSAWSD